MAERPMTHELREKIKVYIKNHIDISELIKDVCIKNEDLSRAIISDFYRVDTDISNCNLSYCTIGAEDKTTHIVRTKMVNCNCAGTKFIGKVWLRSCDARNCNFKGADLHNLDYQFTDFRGSSFCESIITISTRSGIGARFPKELFEELCKGWKLKIEAEETE